MERIKMLQEFVDEFSEISYHGIYLWKHIEIPLISGMFEDFQNQKRNKLLTPQSDAIENATKEQIKEAKSVIDEITPKDILFFMIPIRRMYQGRLEHTAMEAYLDIMDVNNYGVLEVEYDKQHSQYIQTRNRESFHPSAITSIYGTEEIAKNELIEFIYKNYILVIQEKAGVVISQNLILAVVMRASYVIKQSKAFLSYFTQILKKVNPKVVCYTHGEDYYVCFFREAAQKLGIPSVEIAHGASILNLIYPPQIAYFDYFLTHSDILTDAMRNKGIKNVYTVGKPDKYKNLNSVTEAKYPIVITVVSSLEEKLFLDMVEVAKQLDKKRYLIAYKSHSSEKWTENEMKTISDNLGNWQFISGNVDVRDMFAISNIVIGMRSSAVLDALPYENIKVILIDDEFSKEGLLNNVEFFDILAELGDIIKTKKIDTVLKEIQSYNLIYHREKVNHYWPENSAYRVQEFMQRFIDGKEPNYTLK